MTVDNAIKAAIEKQTGHPAEITSAVLFSNTAEVGVYFNGVVEGCNDNQEGAMFAKLTLNYAVPANVVSHFCQTRKEA
jgi:hypothetical protein